ncbi:hypothetical protein AB0G05_38290 [Nonomuraea wenchangensis]
MLWQAKITFRDQCADFQRSPATIARRKIELFCRGGIRDEEMTLKIQIVVDQESGDRDDVGSLYRWLRQDPDVARDVALSPGTAGAHPPGRMGEAFEVINAVVDGALGLGNLLLAYMGWRDSRRARADRPPVITVISGDVVLDISSATPDTVQAIVDALDRE